MRFQRRHSSITSQHSVNGPSLSPCWSVQLERVAIFMRLANNRLIRVTTVIDEPLARHGRPHSPDSRPGATRHFWSELSVLSMNEPPPILNGRDSSRQLLPAASSRSISLSCLINDSNWSLSNDTNAHNHARPNWSELSSSSSSQQQI